MNSSAVANARGSRALGAQQPRERGAHGRVVIDDEEAHALGGDHVGTCSRKVDREGEAAARVARRPRSGRRGPRRASA